ncbi:hypothetical protein BDV95DRAFT_591547 [Massariosphaeria phaeospora]|uniref:Rhodopsin domain-containing protein n=1 Tax=Massariosphaeria phaeospora TaxID=100035 RepID=A0A7C8MC36_9PLEO|nr:hypothetical protein BDV95DRAFT_591547 [Massariosphaeria phaeospora]
MDAPAIPELPFPGPDIDRGPHVVAAYVVGCAVSGMFIALRLWSRISIQALGLDDWCMVLTWIIFIPFTALVCLLAMNGGTRHLYYLLQTPSRAIYVTKLNWITQVFAIFCGVPPPKSRN